MVQDLVQLSFDKIMQTRSYTVIILGTKEKRFAIYADPSVGRLLQIYLMNAERPRPLTHDLIYSIMQATELEVKQVVINELDDTVYFARIFLEQKIGDQEHIIEIDIRPSDALVLALMTNAPVFCTRNVLEKTLPVVE